MPLLRIVILSFVSAWLTSCATIPATPEPQNKTQEWNTRSRSLSEVQQWQLKSLIAIRNIAKNDSVTANLQWQQTAGHYSILVFGPFGAGSAKLNGGPGNVTLETSDGKTFHGSSPEQILAEQTNLNLPVSNLFYWIRGLPAPGASAKKQFDAYHHLIALQQQGWQIQFLSYTSANQIDVPNKIFLSNSQFDVKIIIKEWKI